MAVVTISEASRLTGKDRRTLQRHIAAGKLSKSTIAAGGLGVDTAELMRVYGAFIAAPAAPDQGAAMPQQTAPHAAPHAAPSFDSGNDILKAEIDNLKALLAAKQETIDSLNRAMLLLEHKANTETISTAEKPKKSFWSRFFDSQR